MYEFYYGYTYGLNGHGGPYSMSLEEARGLAKRTVDKSMMLGYIEIRDSSGEVLETVKREAPYGETYVAATWFKQHREKANAVRSRVARDED